MEKKKKNKALHRLACAVLALTIALSATVGAITSTENVAKADYMEYTPDGKPIYTVARLNIPVLFEYLNNSSSFSMGYLSVGMKFLPYNSNRYQVNFYNYYYALDGDSNYVMQSDPYPATFVPPVDDLTYVYVPVNGESYGLPTDMFYTCWMYVDSNFVGNVHYVEIGNSFLDGEDTCKEVLGTSLYTSLRNEMLYFTYFKYVQHDGASLVVAIQTMLDEGLPNMGRFMASGTPYRKYYTISIGDLSDTEQYNQGYISGKNEGYIDGLREGQSLATEDELENAYHDGYQQAITDEAGELGTFAGWGEAVLEMLNVPIFGSFGLGTIISLIAGILLVLGLLNLLKG